MATSSSPLSITATRTLQAVRAATPQLVVGNIVNDGFESADFSSPGYPNFSWSNVNRTYIVTSEAVVYDGTGVVYKPSTKDRVPKSGQHSLMFQYPPGAFQSEQRFNIGGAYPEIWMSFWLRVPVNFSHPSAPPANQKLFNIWMDGYSNTGAGSTAGMEFSPNGAGGSNFFVKVSSGDFNVTNAPLGTVPFITVPDDQGRWMSLVVHIKSETQPNLQDGVMGVWRKWEDEQNYSKTHDLSSLPIKLDSAAGGFKAGYLMGFANSPYPDWTEFFIDDFKLSTTSLL
jgi:hypothetical protein